MTLHFVYALFSQLSDPTPPPPPDLQTSRLYLSLPVTNGASSGLEFPATVWTYEGCTGHIWHNFPAGLVTCLSCFV